MMYQYFVKIVPTIYMKTDGEVSGLCVVLRPSWLMSIELMDKHHPVCNVL